MSSMIQNLFRVPVTRLISPVARWLLKIGVTPNAITIVGALGSSISAVILFGDGRFFLGSVLVTIFILSDLFDGTMARLSNTGSTKWGALIDSTLDRIADAAIFVGIAIYANRAGQNHLFYWSLLALITGAIVPYIRAKAESLGITCSVGIAERTERLIVILVGTGLFGLGVNWALSSALIIVSIASAVTIVQRMLVVARAD
jgi:CDP-diacylglycerol--glycerol-3-phosphate 3-phosphatidyltransferase